MTHFKRCSRVIRAWVVGKLPSLLHNPLDSCVPIESLLNATMLSNYAPELFLLKPDLAAIAAAVQTETTRRSYASVERRMRRR